jgi:allantoicase
MLTDECHWPELMAKQKLEMDKIHNFDGNLINKIGEVSHLRLNIFPDGGVSRFRIFGSLSSNDT